MHNTYGDRHAYLVHPDAQGRASTDKQMYVSPFHGVDGHYELAVPEPGERLHVAVTLHPDEGAHVQRLAGRRALPRAGRGVALRTAPAGIRTRPPDPNARRLALGAPPAHPAPTHPRTGRSVP